MSKPGSEASNVSKRAKESRTNRGFHYQQYLQPERSSLGSRHWKVYMVPAVKIISEDRK